MKHAWIENNKIRDIAPGIPSEIYHPDIAAHYTAQVPDDAENGDGWVTGALVKPVPAEPPAPEVPVIVPPNVSPVEFMLLFKSAERVAIKALRATDPVIDDFLDVIEDPRLTLVNLGLGSTGDALDYMTYKGLIAVGRKEEIRTGVLI